MSTPPAGWYPDPQSPDDLRWYDGTGWTEHVTRATPATPTQQVAPEPQQVGAPVAVAAATPAAAPAAAPVGAGAFAQGWEPGGQAWASAAPVTAAQQHPVQHPALHQAPQQHGRQHQGAWQGQVPTQGGPGGWQQAPPARSGMGTGLKVLITLGIALALLMILGVLAAIAIPVYLNQQQQAALEPVRATTCEQVAAETINLSAQEVAASTEEQIPLVSLTETTLVDDRRATVTAPSPGTEALVMVCEGTGVWADDFTSTVTVSLFVDAGLETFQTVTWEE